ncbi:MAG: transcriptional repressor [Candidatus Saccharimonadales bacterium]
MTNLDQFSQILVDHNHSVTKTRKDIFITLDRSHQISMKELYAGLSNTNRSSIYRNIDLFLKLNIVNKIQIGWKYKIELSDAFRQHHHHIICNRCGKVKEFKENPAITQVIKDISIDNEFVPLSHEFSILGLCNSCK